MVKPLAYYQTSVIDVHNALLESECAAQNLTNDVIMANTASHSSSVLEMEVSCPLKPDFISET
jgi:hypothetical protein